MSATDPAHPTITVSDGTVAEHPSPEVVAERQESYEAWKGRVSRSRSIGGHETVVTRADPLNWTPLTKPLSECTVALLSSGGVHLRSQEPFDVFAHEGDSTVREIPGDVDTAQLTVTHTHYATGDAMRDINVMFPLDRLRELADEGFIGSVSPVHFGFMGFIPDPSTLLDDAMPAVVEQLQRNDVDVVLMTPG